MKPILLSLLICLGCWSSGSAQELDQADPGKREQKIQALYAAYITQELNLTADEAQKFWPVHAQFDADLKAVDANLPELDKQQSLLNIKKKYQDKFIKIIGPNRCDQFFRKDSEFRKRLVERLRKLREQNNGIQRPMKRRNF